MKNVPDDELFSAYLDGELTADERACVEHLLATSPEARQLLESLKALSATMRSLPVHKLDEDLSERVLRLAERRMLSEPAASPQGGDGRTPSEPGRSPLPSPHDSLAPDDFGWHFSLRRLLRPRNLVFPAAAVAIALLLAVTERGRDKGPAARVAMAPPAASRTLGDLAEREKTPAEQPVIGPMKGDARSEAANVVTANEPSNRSAGEVVPAEAKPIASPLSSSVANSNMPSNAVPFGAAKAAPAGVPGMMPSRPLPAEEEKNAGDRRSNLPVAGIAGKSAAEKPADKDRQLKESASDTPAPAAAEPTLVVRCDVTDSAAARGLLEQVLGKQQIALNDGDSKQPAVMGGGDRKDAGEAQQFVVEISSAQLEKALGELKTHTKLFASYSLDPQPAPVALDSMTVGREPADRLKKSAKPAESQVASELPPGFKGDLMEPPTRSRSANLRAGQGGMRISSDSSGSMQDHFSRGTSQTPILSQRAQQVTPSQQMPSTSSQMGLNRTLNLSQSMDQAAPSIRGAKGGGQFEAKAEKSAAEAEPLAKQKQAAPEGQTSPEEAKQRVVFVFRVTAPAADRLADQEKAAPAKRAKDAAKAAVLPAKPAAPSAATPASPATPK